MFKNFPTPLQPVTDKRSSREQKNETVSERKYRKLMFSFSPPILDLLF
jgi:hypothetical protein